MTYFRLLIRTIHKGNTHLFICLTLRVSLGSEVCELILTQFCSSNIYPKELNVIRHHILSIDIMTFKKG